MRPHCRAPESDSPPPPAHCLRTRSSTKEASSGLCRSASRRAHRYLHLHPHPGLDALRKPVVRIQKRSRAANQNQVHAPSFDCRGGSGLSVVREGPGVFHPLHPVPRSAHKNPTSQADSIQKADHAHTHLDPPLVPATRWHVRETRSQLVEDSTLSGRRPSAKTIHCNCPCPPR